MTQNADDKSEINKLRAEIERLQAQLADIKSMQDDAASPTGYTREDIDQLGEKVQEGVQELHRQIDANPVPSALMAFVLGFLIARVITR